MNKFSMDKKYFVILLLVISLITFVAGLAGSVIISPPLLLLTVISVGIFLLSYHIDMNM